MIKVISFSLLTGLFMMNCQFSEPKKNDDEANDEVAADSLGLGDSEEEKKCPEGWEYIPKIVEESPTFSLQNENGGKCVPPNSGASCPAGSGWQFVPPESQGFAGGGIRLQGGEESSLGAGTNSTIGGFQCVPNATSGSSTPAQSISNTGNESTVSEVGAGSCAAPVNECIKVGDPLSFAATIIYNSSNLSIPSNVSTGGTTEVCETKDGVVGFWVGLKKHLTSIFPSRKYDGVCVSIYLNVAVAGDRCSF